MNTCKYPGCVALANTGRDHCTPHYPENVAARAVEAVVKNFWPLIGRKYGWTGVESFQRRMTKVRDTIVDTIRK